MTRRDRVRLLVAVALSVALVGPVGWMWWHSRLPSAYTAMSMGYADYGGGPRPAAGAGHDGMGGMGGTDDGESVSVPSLDTEATGPPDVVVDLTARAERFRLASGQRVDGFTLNGSSPGPVIEATVGQLVEVRLHNESVRGGVALHWHGVDVPNAEDGVAGVTQDAVPMGDDFTYRWVAPHVGTFWYHSHQMSNEQVAGGLLGGLVVRPATPSTERDVLGIAHVYGGDQTLNGRTGEQRIEAAPGERVRVRLVNTDNGPQTAWVSGPFRVLAMDGYDVTEAGEVTGKGVHIPAGGRADVEVSVPTDGSATRVQLLGDIGFVVGPAGSKAPLPEQPEDDVDPLHYGTPAPTGIDTSSFDRNFEYSIGRRPGFLDGRPGLWWSVNGHLYPDMPMMTVREGDVVRMRISNHSGQLHPMHLHGHHAVVLSRDGVAATGSPWWFDSLDVRNGESYEIAFLADNPGIWMDHCHNLKHATEGLVTHLAYEGVTTPFKLGEDSGNEPE